LGLLLKGQQQIIFLKISHYLIRSLFKKVKREFIAIDFYICNKITRGLKPQALDVSGHPAVLFRNLDRIRDKKVLGVTTA
jgi:hypothetical protein